MTVIALNARKTARRRLVDKGLIRFGDISISCAIRNVSNGGLSLDVGSQVGIPDQFTLIIVEERKTYSCNVVWRKARCIGVAFN
jgi:hypothetical protein